MDAFWGNNEVLLKACIAGFLENKLGKWSTPSWIVDDVFDDTNDLGGLLGGCKRHELGSAFPVVSVSAEDVTITFTLCTDDMSHRKKGMAKLK